MKWRAKMGRWRWMGILWLRVTGANSRGVKGVVMVVLVAFGGGETPPFLCQPRVF